MESAEIQHILSFSNTSSIGSSERISCQYHDHLAVRVWGRELSDTYTAKSRISLEKRNDSVQVVLVRHSIENEIKGLFMIREISSIVVDENIFRSEATRIFYLVRGSRNDRYF